MRKFTHLLSLESETIELEKNYSRLTLLNLLNDKHTWYILYIAAIEHRSEGTLCAAFVAFQAHTF